MLNTWILVANGARARLFEKRADEAVLNEVAAFSNPAGRALGRETTTDRPPRVNESMGGTRHAIEPHTTLREKSTENFARALRNALEKGRVDHAYDQLVLVAPAHFIGALHALFEKPLRDCVVGEVHRNLIDRSAAQIQTYLPGRAPVAT